MTRVPITYAAPRSTPPRPVAATAARGLPPSALRPPPSRLLSPAAFRGKYYVDLRGKYRIFDNAVYRFYRSNVAPPEEGSSPYATSTSLPHLPAALFADGTWYLACSYFNGCIDSGFLPVGPHGETYLRLDLDGGADAGSPPAAPLDWRLEQLAGGVVRVHGVYYEAADRATSWAIAYTTDGGAPPAGDPDVTVAMDSGGEGLAVLSYDLPAAADGTTVKVRLQTLRGSSYSEGSTVKEVEIDTDGPSAPLSGGRWNGVLPEQL